MMPNVTDDTAPAGRPELIRLTPDQLAHVSGGLVIASVSPVPEPPGGWQFPKPLPPHPIYIM